MRKEKRKLCHRPARLKAFGQGHRENGEKYNKPKINIEYCSPHPLK